MPVLKHGGGRARFEVIPLGASLHRLEVATADGSWQNVLLSRADVDSPDYSRFGATIGRVAGRIGGARVDVDGVRYHLDMNSPPHHLHGGAHGFDSRHWEVISHTGSATTLRLLSPDGDQGYPGNLTAEVTYTLLEHGVQARYSARTDAPTVVSLTGHPYFNVVGPLGDHRITVPASHYCPARADHVPTGEIAPVTDTAFDFRDSRILGEALDALGREGMSPSGGINHDFVIDGTGLRDHVRIEGPTGIVLTIRSDAPTVHLYTGDHLGHAGLAVEPQAYQDAPNHPSFDPIVLRPGETYQSTTQWIVS